MKKAQKTELKLYFSVLAHIIVFTFVIVATTVVLHEYGHFFVGNYLECDNIEIVLLDGSYETFTQMRCPSMPDNSTRLLLISGFTFVIPFAVVLYFLSKYEKYHSFVVLGFNFIISSSDISNFPEFFSYASLLLGSGLIIYGEALLVDRYIGLIEGNRSVILSYLGKQ